MHASELGESPAVGGAKSGALSAETVPPPTDPDLDEVIAAWPALPEHLKAAVLALVRTSRPPGTPDICNCESPRFDVDGYGRSFFPDAARFRVGVLDTNGNLIGWFGSYGNADSAGLDSKVPAPAIPLYWPYHVSVADGAVYVGDRLNRRVVRVQLAHAVAETVNVPRQ